MRRVSNALKWAIPLTAVIATTGLVAAPVAADDPDDVQPSLESLVEDRYVVVMDEVPLVTEFGRDDVKSAEAQQRGDEMTAAHHAAATAAGVAASEIDMNFTAALNGFSIELDANELARMKDTAGVLAVVKDTIRYPQTDSSVDFLGLLDQGGAHRSNLKGTAAPSGVVRSGTSTVVPSGVATRSTPPRSTTAGRAPDRSSGPRIDRRSACSDRGDDAEHDPGCPAVHVGWTSDRGLRVPAMTHTRAITM